MRLRILSDLHREFGSTQIPHAESDVIILAGDVSTKMNGLPWIKDFCEETPTIYVCGNHEFYGAKLPKLIEDLQKATTGSNIHVLEDTFFSIGEWHFYGCTLWTDMALLGDWRVGAIEADDWMNDYKRIRNSSRGYKRLSATDTRNVHLRSLDLMRLFFQSHDPKKTVVITHHAPSLLSLPERRRGELVSCAYASNLDAFIEEQKPAYWIHGHIHCSNDYKIGSTRVMANPQAYPMEMNEGFIPDLTIDI